jgi:pyruvate, orthophosphate dikinase
MAKKKYVYYFGDGKAEGTGEMKSLLGGKGANLAEMVNLKLPVPPGFTISTEVCTYFYDHERKYPRGLEKEVLAAMKKVEKSMNMRFGDKKNPLLVSVRSGARASMPGMMDTVLNLGLNDETVTGLIEKTDNPRFVYDSYRRFIQMYGDVVMGLKPEDKDAADPFEEILERKKWTHGFTNDTELTTDHLIELVQEFKHEIKLRTGKDFPEDPLEQLWGAIGAVFNSWMNERAVAYRRMYGIPQSWGTAVNVQAMVFGNMGEDSGTGVAFTRDPATGENRFYGEFLMNAQGEDVVAGTRTPLPIEKLEEINPKVFKQLLQIRSKLDRHYREMQDVEFTIQEGKLYMLQTRAGKRTGFAAIKIAVDMVEERLIKKEDALMRIEPEQLNQLLRPIFDMDQKRHAIDDGRLLAKGLNAGPGAACGRIVFNASDAVEMAKSGDPVILTRVETSPEDIKGMEASHGILTARGGMTSHAALVARQMGKICVAGCGALEINYRERKMQVNGKNMFEGDWISIDGSTGEVIEGKLDTRPSEVLQVLLDGTMKTEDSEIFQMYDSIMKWADQYRRLKIRTNADQPDQATNAIRFGAEGIGLCRTEHMFFGGDRITAVREMILSDTLEGRRRGIMKLLPMQREDFIGIFRAMDGYPVTIRTLDPPLHEFLPHDEKDIAAVAEYMEVTVEKIKRRIESLHEFNPMLGHRGCRLGIVYPEITEMQARAILEAACEVKNEGVNVLPEIMIPLVGHSNELKHQRQVVDRVAKEVMEQYGIQVDYLVGTMIELPRAALTADQIAEYAQFFSYGTNDLTQTTFGLSRDDAGNFLQHYYDHSILENDPFATVDVDGVGELMRIGTEKGRSVVSNLKVGICGEHGGDPKSVELCHRLDFDYVSCSPFRVPIARLAAARGSLREVLEKKQATTGKRKVTAKKAAPARKKKAASKRAKRGTPGRKK